MSEESLQPAILDKDLHVTKLHLKEIPVTFAITHSPD